jgi:hypothetical protein
MASKTGTWLASFAAQLITPATSIVSANITPVADRTKFPCAFVSAESGDINLDIKTVLDARFEVTVLVQGKSSEQVWQALEEILVLLIPYTQSNAMYSSGVNFIAPLSWSVPRGDDSGTNETIEGTIMFDVRVRYAY